MEQYYNRHPHILIVDDNIKNIQVLGQILIKENYQINAAETGLQALEMVKELVPDLILLDVMMPDMDGLETCKRLKASASTKDVPVIFLTAKTETEDIVLGFETGAVDYITKPFNTVELLARVRTHLELKFSKEKIIKQNYERGEMLHILCHDLSNPIWGIQMTMQRTKDPEELFMFRGKVLQATNSAINIIELVKNLRALEEGKQKIVPETFQLKEAVDQSLDMLQQRFIEKKISHEVNLDESINIQAERTSFVNSVLNNILTNAIKFSFPDSKVIISAQEIKDEVVLSICDSGIGMSKTLKENLFNVNQETNRFGTKGERGTGFGMPIVKKFVNLYGGRIEIFSKEQTESQEHHGTEVKVYLKKG